MDEPYRNPHEPGRKDINGEEWWACDPYPTWYRYDGFILRADHPEWIPDDPVMIRVKAEELDQEANKLYEKVLKLKAQAELCRENADLKEESAALLEWMSHQSNS